MNSRGLKIALGVAVTFACLGIILWRIGDFDKIAASFARADYRTLPVLLACLVLFYWIKAVRWAMLLAPLRPEQPLPAHRTVPALMIGFMGNNILPAHLGEFLRVFVLGRQYGLPKAAIFSTVVLERLCDVAAILAVLAWGLWRTPAAGPAVQSAAVAAGAVLAVMVAVLVLYAVKTAWFVRTTEWTLSKLPLVPAGLKHKVCELLEAGAAGMAALRSGRLAAGIAATSLAQWVVNAVMIYVSLWAFGIDQPPAVAAVVVGVVALGVTVPSTPGFFGVIQLCFLATLGPLGVSEADAFSASIYYHFTQYVPVTLTGLFFLNRIGLRLGELQTAARAEETADSPVSTAA